MDANNASKEPPDSLQHTAEALSAELNSKFTDFVGSLCNKNITFWNCVRVSGQLDFQIDDGQYITINISEVVVLAASHENDNVEPATATHMKDVSGTVKLERPALAQDETTETTGTEAQEVSEGQKIMKLSQIILGGEEQFFENEVTRKDLEEIVKLSEQAGELKKQKGKGQGKTGTKCNGCGKTFRNRKVKRSHRCTTLDEANLTCDICQKTFTSSSTLYHHKRGLHESVKPYSCHLCQKSFSFHHSLKLHILKHEGKRPFQCSMCSKSYLTSNHLKNHFIAIHGDVRPYKCSLCQKSFPYENSLKSHMLLHTGQRPYLCTTCGKSFTARSALKNHEITHSERAKTYECDVCHKKYKSEMLLKTHKRRHTSDGSRFVCDICGHTFMYKSNLDAHYSVHGEERKFKCNVCEKSFKTPATLHSHFLVHKIDTPFECKHCSKSFKSKERLIAHERRHSGDKPYQCDLCGHCFPDKGGLSKHRKTVHSAQKKFACPVCSKTCSRADNLRTHMKVHNNPSLLKLTHRELMVPDVSDQQVEQSTSNVYLGGDYNSTYIMADQTSDQMAAASVSSAPSADFNSVQLQQSLSKQVSMIEGGSTQGGMPLLLQVGQDGHTLTMRRPEDCVNPGLTTAHTVTDQFIVPQDIPHVNSQQSVFSASMVQGLEGCPISKQADLSSLSQLQ